MVAPCIPCLAAAVNPAIAPIVLPVAAVATTGYYISKSPKKKGSKKSKKKGSKKSKKNKSKKSKKLKSKKIKKFKSKKIKKIKI